MGDKNLFNKLIDKLDKFYEAIGGHSNVSECDMIVNNAKLEAKCKADMIDAINSAPNENIKNQLIYRMNEGIYEYKDLIDPKDVRTSSSYEIPV